MKAHFFQIRLYSQKFQSSFCELNQSDNSKESEGLRNVTRVGKYPFKFDFKIFEASVAVRTTDAKRWLRNIYRSVVRKKKTFKPRAVKKGYQCSFWKKNWKNLLIYIIKVKKALNEEDLSFLNSTMRWAKTRKKSILCRTLPQRIITTFFEIFSSVGSLKGSGVKKIFQKALIIVLE